MLPFILHEGQLRNEIVVEAFKKIIFIFAFANFLSFLLFSDFPCGLSGKEPACNAGDLGFNLWVRKIP